MDTKLTLKLKKQIIDKAKEYASDRKISLSRLVESYLQALTSETEKNEFEISPFVKSISSGTKLPADLDYKKEYADHLIQKYK